MSEFESDDPWLEIGCNWDDIDPLPAPPLSQQLEPQELSELFRHEGQQPQEFFQGQLDHSLASARGSSPILGPIDAASIFHESSIDALPLSPAHTKIQGRLERENEGRCADCGAQTHQVKLDPSGKTSMMMKVPLTVPGEVHRGRCLFCHPLPASLVQKQSTDHGTRPTNQATADDMYQLFKAQKPAPRRRSTVSNLEGQPYPMPQSRPSPCQKRSSISQDLPLSYLQDLPMSSVGGQRTTASFNDRFTNLHAYRNILSTGSDTASVSSNQNLASPGVWSHSSAPVWTGGQQYKPPFNKDNSGGSKDDFAEKFQQQQLLIEQMQNQLNLQRLHNQGDDGSIYSQASQHSSKRVKNEGGNDNNSHHSQQIHPSFVSQRSSHSYPQLSSPLQPYVNNIVSDIPVVSGHSEAIYKHIKEKPNLDIGIYIQAMRQFPSHVLIQECALTYLLPRMKNNTEVAKAIGNMGGVSVIIDAMRNHTNHLSIQHNGCEMLLLICKQHPENRQVLMQFGGIQVLVKMMNWHMNDTDLQQDGCKALACVAEGGVEYKIAVAEAGGILAVMKAVEIHPDNETVLMSAYRTLRMLGYNPGQNGGGGGNGKSK